MGFFSKLSKLTALFGGAKEEPKQDPTALAVKEFLDRNGVDLGRAKSAEEVAGAMAKGDTEASLLEPLTVRKLKDIIDAGPQRRGRTPEV